MKRLLIVALTSLSVLMVGCEDHLEEAKQEINAIDSVTKANVAPVPEFADAPSVNYMAYSSRSPFYPTSLYSELKNAPAFQSVYVNPNRKRQPLEDYELDTLTMVGVLSKGGKLSAVMQTPDKNLVVVNVGTYMGLNQGRVTKISKQGLSLVEIIPNGRGGYRERERTITSVEDDEANSSQPLKQQ